MGQRVPLVSVGRQVRSPPLRPRWCSPFQRVSLVNPYDAAFYDENVRVGLVAARMVMPWVIVRTKAKSIIDVGCGSAAWLSVAQKPRVWRRIAIIDGNAENSHRLIDPEEFEQADIREGVDCSGYDLAMCLEVGEHLPETSAANLVAGLCQAPIVFWSAAVPGQGGVDHFTERWPSWWERFFNECGYRFEWISGMYFGMKSNRPLLSAKLRHLR